MIDNEKILEKIQKLLSLATSPNENEAKLAAEKANELLIRHNLKLQDVTEASSRKYLYHTVFQRKRRSVEAKYINTILMNHFFVKIMYGKKWNSEFRVYESTIQLVGTEVNVQVAEYVFNFLVVKYKQLWENYKKEFNASTASKQSYYFGLTQGLDEQLSVKRKSVETETGLMVIPDKALDAELDKYSKVKNRLNASDMEAAMMGKADGRKIQISKGIESNNGYQGNALEYKK